MIVLNFRKACKCYQKAHELNLSSEEAGSALSDMLRILGNHVITLLISASFLHPL